VLLHDDSHPARPTIQGEPRFHRPILRAGGDGTLAAFVTWAKLIVRANRGEDVEEDWRVVVSSAAAVAAFVLESWARARETAALRGAAVEMRELVGVAAADA
jgi:hypothetical protein